MILSMIFSFLSGVLIFHSFLFLKNSLIKGDSYDDSDDSPSRRPPLL